MVKARKEAERQAKADYAAKASEPTTDDAPVLSTSVELVLVGRKERINEWVDDHYGKLQKGRARRSKSNYSAGAAGRAAAGRADMGGSKGVGGSRGSLPKGK